MKTPTRILMQASAAFMAVLGMAATFMPQELLAFAGSAANATTVLIVQIAGALYVGFAMLNWMARGLLIGGIYGRPLTVANLAHFMISALGLAKAAASGPQAPAVIAGAVVYSIFAVLFALVFLGHPSMTSTRRPDLPKEPP